MATYPRATIIQRSGKKGWYVCVTVPPELRALFSSPQRYKKIRGAETKQDAWDTYKKYEAEIWIEFDRANLANHPLCKAYDALKEATDWIKSNRVDYYLVPEGEEWEPPEALDFEYEHLFDNELRWQWYDIVRNKAGYVLAYPDPGMADPEESMSIAVESDKIQPLLDEFDHQFKKVSQENFAPKKRGKLFSEVAQEYHQSGLFLRNRKTNELKRNRTTNKEKRCVERFLGWVNPAITIDEFGYKLATDYMEALADPQSGLIQNYQGNAPSNETIADNFSAIKNVLNWAVRNEYIVASPWADVTVAGYGEAKKSYRDWTEDELRQLFSLDMPPQDFLCLAILACTGARLDEIALMRWDQFENGLTKDGETVHWIDVTDAIVKNRPSKRLIPILPRVAELISNHPRGLNKKDPDRLFTWTLDNDGKAENKASRDLMKHLRKVSTDDNFAVHGLRHTVTTMCRVVRMDWEMREFLLGRGGKGEGANYGKAAHIETNLQEMRNFDISFLDGQRAITKQKQIAKQ